MPAADQAGREPLAHLQPRRVVTVLVARQHDPRVRARGGGDPLGLRTGERHGLLTDDVEVALQRPEDELEVRRCGRTHVDEIEAPEALQVVEPPH